MIAREQLAEALGRLDPRARKILDYSLRRRLPDEDLAVILGVAPGDVLRLRAAAVGTLSSDLGVQGGSDLGDMLKHLLEAATWEMVPSPPAAAPTAAPSVPEPPAAQPPVGAEGAPAAPTRQVGTDAASAAPAPAAPAAAAPAARAAPGLQGQPTRGRAGRRAAVGLAVAMTLLVPAGVVAALSRTDPATTGASDSESGSRPFVADRQAVGEPFPSDPESAFQYPVAYVERPTVLYDKPGGEAKLRIAAKTDWGTPRVLGIVKREGSWLSVVDSELDNGEVGWIRDSAVKRLETVSWAIHVDLSQRRLVVRRRGEDQRSMEIGVGRTGHSTPVGRYVVTDKLRVNEESSPYGCCVLALSGQRA